MSDLIANVSLVTIILLVVGLVLIIVEMHVPGFGIPGISGIVCLILAVVLTAQNFGQALVMSLVILVILGIILGVTISLFAKGKLFKPLILSEEQKKENGFISSSDLEYLLGKKGVAITDLRPSGSVDIDGVKFDVLSDGEYISKETKVEICNVNGAKILVKKL